MVTPNPNNKYLEQLETATAPGDGSWILVSDGGESDPNDKPKKYPFDKVGTNEGIEYVLVNDVADLTRDLVAQAKETTPKLFHLLNDMTYSGTNYKWGDTLLVGPKSSDVENGPNIPLYSFEYVSHHVETATDFQGYCNGHVGNDGFLFLRSDGAFDITLLRGEIFTTVAGETYWVYPRSYTPHRFINFTELAHSAGYRKTYGVIAINPKNIATHEDVNRTYAVKVTEFDVDYWNALGTDQWEFWFEDEAIQSSRGNWTPVKEFDFNAVVDTTEETQIGLSNTAKFVKTRLVLRNDGNYVGELVRFITVGDNSAASGGPEGYPEIPANEAEATLWNLRVPATTGKATFQKVQAQPASLNQAQQIGLLSINPDPELIDYPEGGLESALTRTISLRIPNPQLLTGDIWYEGEIDGVPIVDRTKWTERTLEIQYVISSTTAQTIGQNPQLRLNINFYDAASAGTFVTSRRYDIPLIKHPKQYGGGFGIMTAGQYAPVGGISLAGYSSSLTPAAGSPGSITGHVIETIGGLYTVLLNTTVSGTYVGLEATKTYFVKPSNGSGRTPLAVIINGGVFAVGDAIRNRWYEVIGFNSIAVKQTYNIQVVFTDGRSLIEHHIPRPLHQSVSATSANTSVNADNGLTCDMPISFNTTLTITGGEDGLYLTIRPTQDTTGSRTITYSGAALDISTAGKSRDFLLFQREGAAWVLLGIRKGGDL